jgi:TatD DNase family protein
MEFIDTHCHLQFENYNNREDEVLAEANRSGVKRVICVGTSLPDSQAAIELAKTKSGVWATAGVHPHEAGKFLTDPNAPKKLEKIASLPRVVAIGETGLDFYKQYSSKSDQEQVLRIHIEAAIELDLPMVFHVRDAWEDFWRIFDSYKGISGVIHSFSTHSNQLDEILQRGLYVGLNGIMTFTEDQYQLEAAKTVPADRFMLETDAPFLTPVPYRDELCEPKHILATAQFLAELRGESLAKLAAATTATASGFFGLEKKL